MPTIQRISPCLWFADEAEEAARFYTGIFKNSRITTITRYGTAGFETHHRPAGSVMVVAFELDASHEVDDHASALLAVRLKEEVRCVGQHVQLVVRQVAGQSAHVGWSGEA